MVDTKSENMKKLIQWIKSMYDLTAIPVRIKNEKRWESMDEIIDRTPLDGMVQRINFGDGYGVIVYDWTEMESATIVSIKTRYMDHVV